MIYYRRINDEHVSDFFLINLFGNIEEYGEEIFNLSKISYW